MHRRDGKLIVSATDLVGFLECGHLTNLELQADAGLIHKPSQREDPEVLLLQRRGHEHEARYIDVLRSRGLEVVTGDDDWDHSYDQRAARTVELMHDGVDVIYQATVFDGRWLGFPDFLMRKEGRPSSATRLYRFGPGIYRADSEPAVKPDEHTDRASGIYRADSGPARQPAMAGEDAGAARAGQTGTRLGHDWHYEVADTKLAHTAKASALIQIASYVEQIERIQGVRPEKVYVVTGGKEIQERPFRTAEMMAYFRHAKRRFEQTLALELDPSSTYPDPVSHCDVCKWAAECKKLWHDDDALPIVAGISRAQRTVLTGHNVKTTTALAALTKPFDLDLKKHGQNESMWKAREQARLQLESLREKKTKYELLEPERDAEEALVPDRGLSVLPEPNEGDLFFDIEGDPFAFWEGLEYLFGVWETPRGESIWQDGYVGIWAYDEETRKFSREAEKRAFEEVMDLFTNRLRDHPEMHIYHYGSYEPSHLKILVGRHATREEELDQLLRGRVFVDLYRAVRQGVRVGAESYSIKKLEPLYGYTREIELRDANSSIVEFEVMLEEGDPSGEIKENIRLYNRDDCISTEKLRDWLENRRSEAARQFGFELPRPSGEIEPPDEEFTDRQQAVRELEE